MTERERIATDGEALFTERRTVRTVGSGDELILNIPGTAVDLLDVEKQDSANIEIFSDGIVVKFES